MPRVLPEMVTKLVLTLVCEGVCFLGVCSSQDPVYHIPRNKTIPWPGKGQREEAG